MGCHYVPQQYLRGFEVPDEPGLIWTYDKIAGEHRKIPIKVIAQEADYYDAAVETELSEVVEGPAHAVLGKLRRGESITRGDRLKFAVYTASMMMRVPRRRRKAQDLIPVALASTMNEMRRIIEDWAKQPGTDQTKVAERIAQVETLEAQFSEEPPDSVTDRIRSPWPTRAMVELVFGMPWRVVSAGRSFDRFLTSDNPAYFFEGFGLKSRDAEVTFPLSSDLALMGSWQGTPGTMLYVSAKPALVREVNRRVASGAERFVFYHQQQEWIATLANKAHPYLSRIQW